jgi:glycerol-3-phosphate dehydrogenase
MIQGSHVVVRRLFDHDFAYIFQAPDGRIVFALPYEGDFTLVGTTESEFTSSDLAHPAIARTEVSYLIGMINRYFARDLTEQDVVWTFAGLRPLLAASLDDPKSVTRDYVIDFDRSGPPLLSIYGGKLTTYRRLAEDVVDAICPALGHDGRAWTAAVPLPGGDMADGDFARFVGQMRDRYHWLEPVLLQRYARAYGTRMARLLERCAAMPDLGEAVLPGLYAREIDYLRKAEFARTAEDILFRRSKLGVRLGPGAIAALDAWLARG